MKEAWLEKMMDAALEDEPAEIRLPDFRKLGEHQGADGSKNPKTWALLAAAALLVAIVLPGGFLLGARYATNQIARETNEAFVDQLLAPTIFDEGLVVDDGWISDLSVGDDFFDT